MTKFLDPTPFGYSQYVEIDLGNSKMILLSGQVAIDDNGNTVGKDDLKKQIEEIFIKIKNILKKANASVENIVKLNSYLIDISQLALFRQIRDKHIDINNPPASTAVEVSQLFREDILIEIEATIIIPKK